MRLRRKSPLQRIVQTLGDSLDVANAARPSMPGASPGRT